MLAFISHHPGGIEKLRSRLEKVETELAAAQKAVVDGADQLSRAEEEKGVIRAEADTLKREKEALEGQVNGAEQENLQLKNDVEELRASLVAQKKEKEYQRQVDKMYFFGYRCCMKKNGIMHDIPSLPFDDEDVIPGGPSC